MGLPEETWLNPVNNPLAAPGVNAMNGATVQVVMLIDENGNIQTMGGGGTPSTPSEPIRGESGATSSPAVGTASSSLLAANTDRIEAVVYNNSLSSIIYVKYGPSASLSDFTFELRPHEAGIVDAYQGELSIIADSATADVKVTEVTP